MEIEKTTIDDFFESVKDLDSLLTERISAMHNVPELLQARHVYIFYRKLLWEARDTIKYGIKEKQNGDEET